MVSALMEDRSQDGAIAIGDVGILPVALDEVEGAGRARRCYRHRRDG
jgi:hypothetical protein